MMDFRLIGAGIIGLLLFYFGMNYRMLKIENEALKEKVASCQFMQEAQNKAVMELKTISDQRAQALSVAENKALEHRIENEREVSSILAKEIPTDCNAAVQWAAVNASQIAQSWQ